MGDKDHTDGLDADGLDAADRRPTDPSGSHPSPKSGPKSGKVPLDAELRVDEHVGKTFSGKYRIDKLIARGGMGRVYRGIQFPLERPVAIKILNSEFQKSDPTFVKRFFLEASISAKLNNQHTITVFDYGEGERGELYIAMELLRGRPLSRVLAKDGAFDARTALAIGMQICRALREAHGQGIIHRDLKPGNVFLVDSEEGPFAKVLDFGLVKLFTPENADSEALGNMLSAVAGGDGELTRTGTLLGSPKYMSPEQIQGYPLDQRTDIYSFGVILYQMIAGKAPFTGTTGVDVIYKHVHLPVPPVLSLNADADCPPEVDAIIHKCLQKKREDRYASMEELLLTLKQTLKTLLGGAPINDSIAEVGGPASGPRPKMAMAETASMAAAAPRESSFREQLEEPTPTGVLAPDASGRASPPSSARGPLLIAALGFLVALATLGYVAFTLPQRSSEPAPKLRPTPPPLAPAPAPSPPPVAAPPPEVEPASADDAEEPMEEEPKAGGKKGAKKKKRDARPNKTADGAEGDNLDLPPAYRDNPY